MVERNRRGIYPLVNTELPTTTAVVVGIEESFIISFYIGVAGIAEACNKSNLIIIFRVGGTGAYVKRMQK